MEMTGQEKLWQTIIKCYKADKKQQKQQRRHKTTSTRIIDREKPYVETRGKMFREGQGVRFRKRCKHGSGEAVSVARLWKSPMTECDERRGKTPHERKLHRIAMAKQVRITRKEAYKVVW